MRRAKSRRGKCSSTAVNCSPAARPCWRAPGIALPAHAALSTAPSQFSTDEPKTAREYVSGYNNYYEFGTGKEDPAANAHTLTVKPWTVKIDGMVEKPAEYALEDIVPATLEERIYRFRCVEAWSMVVPWDGFPLADLLNKVGVQAGAKYVAFETLVRPEEMPGQRGFFQPLPWPYVEGLRLDEAMHPLTILATGLYGEANSEPERRADPARRAVEIRLQVDQVDRPHQPDRQAAADDVEHRQRARIRLLLQRQSARSTIRAGARQANGRSARAYSPGARKR